MELLGIQANQFLMVVKYFRYQDQLELLGLARAIQANHLIALTRLLADPFDGFWRMPLCFDPRSPNTK